MHWALLGIFLTALVGQQAEAPLSESYPDSLETIQLRSPPDETPSEQTEHLTPVEIMERARELRNKPPECRDTPPKIIQDISEYEIPWAKPFFLEEGKLLESSPSFGGKDVNWLNDFFISDYCFIGEVTESEYHCLTSPFLGVGSFAYIGFGILESFWGAIDRAFVVDTKVNRPKGCIKYDLSFFESFDIGDKYLVLGRYHNNRQTTLGYRGLYKLSGEEFVYPDGTSWPKSEILSMARQMHRFRDLQYQSSESDLICEAIVVSPDSLNDWGTSQLRLLSVHKGNVTQGTIQYESVHKQESPPDYFISSSLKFGDTYLLFLVKHNEGTFRSLMGWHSTCLIIDDCLFTLSEDYFGKRRDILEEVQGYLEGQ